MTLRDDLLREIHMARQRVYEFADPTPLQRLDAPVDAEVWLKREDLSPIHAYKWRGACNRMKLLTEAERERGVICASAGNHAQGVALAARRMAVRAVIYMPVATPRMKQRAVRQLGGDAVEVVLHGDTYSDAAAQAVRVCRERNLVFVHPYDDLAVMGGQGTLADEVVMSGKGPFDIAYLQIGGGGMAAAVACWLKSYWPAMKVVGVEGVDQASMKAAIAAGAPVELPYLDVFCDGTAVRRAGDLTHALCSELLDDIVTVTNEEVCAAVQAVWDALRVVPEPSGAMGIAGLIKDAARARGSRALTVLCGANMDFGQLPWIARHAGIGARSRRYWRFEISERTGSMLALLETALAGVNIIEFQYGKVHDERAWPVIGFEASPMELALLERRLADGGIPHEDVTSREDVEFRIIHYEPSLFKLPRFIKLEFPERAGALLEFLALVRGLANLVYFNYTYTGERVGRAMMGFEFAGEDDRARFDKVLRDAGRTWHDIPADVVARIL